MPGPLHQDRFDIKATDNNVIARLEQLEEEVRRLQSRNADYTDIAVTTNFSTTGGVTPNFYDDTKDPTGWVDPTLIDVAYDSTTRKITLTGTLDYYWNGTKHTLTSPWVSDAHAATTGSWFLYSTDGQTFAWSQTVWEFYYAMIATVYYGTSDKFGMREVHSVMPWQEHKARHLSPSGGAFRISGGAFTAGSYTVNTATNSANSPGTDALVLLDEDLPSTVDAWLKSGTGSVWATGAWATGAWATGAWATAGGTYTTLRIGAGAVATYDTAATLPFRAGASYIYVNNPATGAETAGANNRYYNVYTIFVPTSSDAASKLYRVLWLQPQATYTTLAAAQAENVAGLVLGNLRTVAPELVIYGRITYITASGDSNTGKVRIATGGISYVIGNSVSITGSAVIAAHASTHQNGGSDEIATETPAAYAIPKADSTGKLDAWVTGGSGAGDVTGPASSTDDNLASFNGITGKAIQDSGLGTAAVSAAVTASHAAVTVVDGTTIDFTLSTQQITAEVKDDSITYAKMQNVSATDKVLGRSTAGSGDVEEIACTSAGRALIDDATAAAQRVTLNVPSLLAISTQSVTTADITGAVNTHYRLNLSSLAADFSLTLPTATVGDEIFVQITNGDISYELILKGAATVTINGGSAATEWSRLFTTDEFAHFRATSSTNWDVVADGRIACKATVTRTGSNGNTTHNADTDTLADFNTIDTNIGNCVDPGGATNRFIVRRAGYYVCGGGYAPAAAIEDQKYVNVLIYKNGTGGTRMISSAIRQSTGLSSPGSSVCSTHLSYKPLLCAAGDYLEYFFKTEQADRGLLRTDYTGGGYEILAGITFFSVTEILR